MNKHTKRKVLFLCTGNSARSILGEYLLRAMDSRFETYSAGAEPTGQVHPMALQILRDDFRIEAGGAHSKSWQSLADLDLDILITVCDHARDTCPIPPESSAIQVHWGSPDPARASPDEAEAAFRRVAAEIHQRLEHLCALPFEQLNRAELTERLQRIGTEALADEGQSGAT